MRGRWRARFGKWRYTVTPWGSGTLTGVVRGRDRAWAVAERLARQAPRVLHHLDGTPQVLSRPKIAVDQEDTQ